MGWARPTSTAAKRAGLLLVVAALALGAFAALVAAGERGGDTFWSNPALTIPMLVAAAAAICAGVAGITALLRDDRSAVPWIATVVGLLVALWVTLELAFPH